MQVYVPREKGIAECEDTGFYDNFNVDEIDLGIENYEELFDAALDNPDRLFDNEDIDGLFGPNDMSGSDCQGAYLAEVVSCCFSYILHVVQAIWKSNVHIFCTSLEYRRALVC